MRGRERDEVCPYSERTPSSVLIGSFRRSTFTKLTNGLWMKKRRDDKPLIDTSLFFIVITVPSLLLVVDCLARLADRSSSSCLTA